MKLITLEEIRHAAARLDGRIVRTPCLNSRTLSEITQSELWLKFENRQFTASFKDRGAFNRLANLTDDEQRRGVIAMSAGNHAQAVAYHAQRLRVQAVIVMPVTTPQVKVRRTRRFGAQVVLEGETIAESETAARRMVEERGLVLVHPYDDPWVCAGQGTLALEMLEDAPALDAVVIPVGGGGLLAGCAAAFKAIRPEIKIYTVESAMFPCLAEVLAGRTPQCGGYTIAEGIAVKAAGAHGIAAAKAFDVTPLTVGEDALERAVSLLINVEKTVAEGAGAAGLAAVLAHRDLFEGQRVGLPICGGNIDSRLLASVLVRDLARQGRLVTLRISSHDAPGELSKIADVIGRESGNIVDVAHNRLALDIPAKGAVFDFLVETRDSAHTQAICSALRAVGYQPDTLAPQDA